MNAFIFVRLVMEILGFGKYLPTYDVTTAEEFTKAFVKALKWAKDGNAIGVLSAEGGRLTLWVHGATVQQEESGSALSMLGTRVHVGANGHYESNPEESFLAIAEAVVGYEDNRVSVERLAETRKVYAQTLVQFVELYPVSRGVTAQVRKALGSLLED